MKLLLSFIFFVCICWQLEAQTSKFESLNVGDEMMNIELKNARNLPQHVKKISDLQGQWILLDFWSIGCVSCIQAFPKLQALQKEFQGRFQLIVINPDKPDSLVDHYINTLKNDEIRKSYRSLASLNGDHVWLDLFPHRTVPHHIWISPQGKVEAITNGSNANYENVKSALEGNELKLLKKEDIIGYNVSKNGLIKQGHDKLPAPKYYSVFMPFHSGIGSGTYINEDSISNTFRCTHRNLSIPRLYKLASLQKRIVIETDNIPKTESLIKNDSLKLKNLLTYELLIPLSQKSNYRHLMMQDLNRYLAMERNIEGVLEQRDFTSYIIVRNKNISHLDKKNNFKTIKKPVSIKNIEALYSFTQYLFENIDQKRIVIEETGLSEHYPLNFSLPEDVKDLDTFRRYILKYGFDIIEGSRTVEVLVIRDKIK